MANTPSQVQQETAEQAAERVRAETLAALGASLAVKTAKADGRTYPDADALAAMTDDAFIAAATAAVAEERSTPGAKAALTKYRQRLAAEVIRRTA